MNRLASQEAVSRGWSTPIRLSRKSSDLIPTWQIGTAQETPDDLTNFALEGYRGNSLIFSCITEIASSFAQLAPVHRASRDGDIIADSALTALLNNPSPAMDGFEFQTTAMVHKKAAGNVYIEKVRQLPPGTPDDFVASRRAMTVKALGLIRPDYIRIEPGARRADDIFVVEINGVKKREIPRADIIHIKDNPDPLNDFYGMSSIALIVTASNLDVQMTRFELAFYQNAGVPYGMLKTNRALDDDEIRETRGVFRRAFSGVRRWFNLLIINQAEATYEQLALKQTDMEQEGTRFHSESRICAVFHVPPILVGARIGLEKSTYANYETALQSFWSETMTNEKQNMASALTRELLPEFRQSPAEVVDYDMSKVKVLQADNTAKAEAVAQLVRSGGFSPAQALEVVGLDAPEGVLEEVVSQTVRETVVEGRSATPLKGGMFHVKQRGQDGIADRREELEVIAAAAETDIATYLDSLGERVVADLGLEANAHVLNSIGAKNGPEPFSVSGKQIGPEEEQLLSETLFPFSRDATESGWRLASIEAGISPAFGLEDPSVGRLLRDTSGRITAITEETRNQIGRFLLDAQERSLTIREIQAELTDLGTFGQARAKMIARTEVAIAQNKASAARWRLSGFVEEVDISDGLECGWTEHNDADAADGSRRTLDEYEEFPSAHPNCVRGASAVVK